MTGTEELYGFEQRLLVELRRTVIEGAVTAVSEPVSYVRRLARTPSRRWAVLAPLTALVVVAVVVGLMFVPRDGSNSSAFALGTLPDGRIHVTVEASFDEGQELEQELRQAGVEVEVLTITSHPRLVGIIEFPAHQLPPEGIERGTGEFWIDPARFAGTVEMLINVAADPGEEWRQAPSVFHPDEPLGGLPCALPGPLDTATLERYARSVGITEFSWSIMEGDPMGSRRVVASETRPDGDVEHAEIVAPGKLRVGVRPPDDVDRFSHASAPSMNLNVHESPEPACTPELASRWADT